MKTQNANYPVCDPRLQAEELETVIAPGKKMQHNDTFLAPAAILEAEVLEPVIAPGLSLNHNETVLPE
jgi:hypothetical protein